MSGAPARATRWAQAAPSWKSLPLKRFVATERFDQAWYPGEAVITITFVEQGGETEVTTTMRYESTEGRDGVLKSGMTDGVRQSYDRWQRFSKPSWPRETLRNGNGRDSMAQPHGWMSVRAGMLITCVDEAIQRSSTRTGDREPEQQIIMTSLAAFSSQERSISRWSGSPASTRVSHETADPLLARGLHRHAAGP